MPVDTKTGTPTVPSNDEALITPQAAQPKQKAQAVSSALPGEPDAPTQPLPSAQREPQGKAKTGKAALPAVSQPPPAAPATLNLAPPAASQDPDTGGEPLLPASSPPLEQSVPVAASQDTPQTLHPLELVVRPVTVAWGKVSPHILPGVKTFALKSGAAAGLVNSRLSLVMKVLLTSVLLPSLLSLFYFGLLSSPMYISEARFAVRGAETSGMAVGLASIFLPSATATGVDAHIVSKYVWSPDIMEAIDGEIGIFRHFSSREHDYISRLDEDATRDERLSYWQWAVKPSLDPETGIISLSVKAYAPDMAKRLTEAVLAKSEALVNEMSSRAQNDAIALALTEVRTAEARVSKAQDALRAFRNRSGMLDPASTAGGLQGIVSQLEAEVVKVRAEIGEASSYMSKGAPTLVGLRARLASLEKQLASEKLRLTGETLPGSLTSFAGEYEALQTENEFARQQLVSAMTSLETARVKAEAKSRYVVAFQLPSLPDESLYPRPFLFTAYVFFGALVLVGLSSLIIAAVREHAGF